MARSSVLARDPFPGNDSGLTELRIETLKILVVIILALVYAAVIFTLYAIPSASPPTSWDPLPLLGGLSLAAAMTFWTIRYGPAISSATMVVSLTLTLTALVILHPGTSLADYFFLIVLAATGASDWRAGLLSSIVASVVVVTVGYGAPGVIPLDVADQSLIFIWLTLPLAWLPSRPLRVTINWAWSGYLLAQSKAEEARLRQAELARVSKSLAEACDRLERLNVALSEAREAAETARRLKAEFAATVGHELRTPINLIIGFSQMMASPRRNAYYAEPLPESYRKDIATIYHNACHVSSLVDDILDLSQIDAHRMALRKSLISLSQVAQEAAASVAALYAEAGLYLSVDIPEVIPLVSADPVRIRQVLINLLYNAVRFTHQGGVVVTAYLTSTDVVVAVQDTGVGIPADGLERLFEEFRQIQSPTRGHVGSGFGLAVCKRFVELHGGNIWAESALDQGTTISFTLPLNGNIATTPFRSLPSPLPGTGHHASHVAVLDPSGDAGRIIQRYLDGHCVLVIKRPEEASQLARNGELQAVIVASESARRSWHEYQRLHEDVRRVPTFGCPVRTREAIATSLRATDYLAKPVGREHLARALRRLGRPVRTIAVIEDDTEMRAMLSRMLRSISRRSSVYEVSDGTDGLRLIRESRPDVVLLDLFMPGLDGYAVIEAIQNDPNLKNIAVIVVSARGPAEELAIGKVEISRYDGLSVGEAMSCLGASLQAVLHPNLVADRSAVDGGTVPEQREVCWE